MLLRNISTFETLNYFVDIEVPFTKKIHFKNIRRKWVIRNKTIQNTHEKTYLRNDKTKPIENPTFYRKINIPKHHKI